MVYHGGVSSVKINRHVIYVSAETKARLKEYGLYGDTFNDIVVILMDNWDKTHNGNVRGIRRKK